MAFWGDPITEPKRSYRWLFYLGGTDDLLQPFVVKTVKKPSFSQTPIEHQFVSHTFYYPGRITWNTVEVTIVDPVEPDSAAVLRGILNTSGYRLPETYADAIPSMSKANSVAALGEPKIEQIDAEGTTIEEWKLVNAFIESVDMGNLDYSTDDLVNLSFVIKYDYAKLTGFDA